MAGITRVLRGPSSLLRAERVALIVAIAIAIAAIACGEDDPPAPYRIVMERLPGGLLSVWGTSARDVWTVGGDAGEGPEVRHYDGERWVRMSTGHAGDLWWVHGFESGPVFFGGEAGAILRWDGSTFERMTTPSATPTVFGIWGSSPSDVLAVGGVGPSAGFVWRFDGTSWSEIALPEGFGGASLFKVWGTSATDAWIVGGEGALLHWDGSELTPHESGTTRTLFTVHADADGSVAAVGGIGSGVLIERSEDGSWHDVAPELVPQLFGVFQRDGEGRAVGINGTFVRREGSRWVVDETGLDLAETLHSVWIDPDGGVWAAGGQVLSEPLTSGLLIYQGRASVATAE